MVFCNELRDDINLTDGNSHRSPFICGLGHDAANADCRDSGRSRWMVLDSRSLADFNNGRYLVWNLAGHVKVRATRVGPYNALVRGFFFRYSLFATLPQLLQT